MGPPDWIQVARLRKKRLSLLSHLTTLSPFLLVFYIKYCTCVWKLSLVLHYFYYFQLQCCFYNSWWRDVQHWRKPEKYKKEKSFTRRCTLSPSMSLFLKSTFSLPSEVNCFLICPYMKFFSKLYSGHNMNINSFSIGQGNNETKQWTVDSSQGSLLPYSLIDWCSHGKGEEYYNKNNIL